MRWKSNITATTVTSGSRIKMKQSVTAPLFISVTIPGPVDPSQAMNRPFILHLHLPMVRLLALRLQLMTHVASAAWNFLTYQPRSGMFESNI